MGSKYSSIDLTNLKTISIKNRRSKVSISDFAKPHEAGTGIKTFLDSLPNIFAGQAIKTVVNRIVYAHKNGKPVVLSIGGHVIKCGLGPILCDLMRRKIITAIAVNGSVAIHDSEIALFGETSEDVNDSIRTGMFGMANETADFLNDSAKNAVSEKIGFGESLGQSLIDAPNSRLSVMATAYEYDIPITVHVSIGSDIVHMHSTADGASIGEASMHDFRILTEYMRDLGDGGILINIGSAVVLPEVLLKSLNILVNLGCDMTGMYGVNLDFIQQYRANMQIVSRVKEIGGDGVSLTGHHEIMVPLIAAGVLEQIG